MGNGLFLYSIKFIYSHSDAIFYSDATLNEFMINDHAINATIITQKRYFELICRA